jgi:CRISPR/Cas system-associated exonuclease Cas4 (RecB family)
MAHSNSSINCFLDCPRKYCHNYLLHTPPCKPPSLDLVFGTMAHEVLCNAGKLRDCGSDDYEPIIPSEVLYNELKLEYGIKNWYQYFVPVITQIYKYETKLIEELLQEDNSEPVRIEREVKLQLTPDDIYNYLGVKTKESLVGVVDLLLLTKNHATIIDYKFSKTRKTQDDFDMNSQLQLYALLVHINFNIPLRNIKIGYIDIPKQALDSPTVLSNGTLSRSKSQNTTQEFYEQAVIAVHGNDSYYNCKPGGHYYDVWCNMALNKPAYLSVQYLDMNVYEGLVKNISETIKVIECLLRNDLPFVGKMNAYSCKSCEYLKACKPWLEV